LHFKSTNIQPTTEHTSGHKSMVHTSTGSLGYICNVDLCRESDKKVQMTHNSNFLVLTCMSAYNDPGPSDDARQRMKKCSHQRNEMSASKVAVANTFGECIREGSGNHIEDNLNWLAKSTHCLVTEGVKQFTSRLCDTSRLSIIAGTPNYIYIYLFIYLFILNLEIIVQQVSLLLRRTGGISPPVYWKVKEYENWLGGCDCIARGSGGLFERRGMKQRPKVTHGGSWCIKAERSCKLQK
jgi:hypothetical protein